MQRRNFAIAATAAIPGLALTGAAASAAGEPRQTANQRTVLAFYEAGLNRKDFDAAAQYLGPTYTQHNPTAADGVDGFRQFVEYLRAHLPQRHSTIVRSFADGDFVILHVHAQDGPDDRGKAIVDIFRLAQGKIVEHWDVIQPVPDKAANSNGMF